MTRILLTIAMTMALAAPALAQGEGEAAAPAGEGAAAAEQAAPAGDAAATAPAGEPPRPYRSELRATCEAELEKDRAWQAELKNSLRPEVHEDDASLMLRNKKHVVMAYAAVWILTVVFLVLLWLRQRRLLAEIDRLAGEVKKAAAS